MCELLAAKVHQSAETLFLVGLFSTLDAILDKPIQEVLELVPLPPNVCAAILEGSGPTGSILRCVLDYERGNWEQVHCLGLDSGDVCSAYLEAIEWAGDVTDEVTSARSP